jgi:pentatricopeptide repeat protein
MDAHRVLDQMTNLDVVSWNSMITAYVSHCYVKEALEIFNEMRRSGIKPDHYTFSSLLPVCTDFAVLQWVHEEIIRSGFHLDAFVGNPLVDMYAKCGHMKDVCDLFEKIPQRKIVSWNALIAEYVHNDCINEALKIFHTMPEWDEVSLTTMIVGYAQNGYVDEALRLFLKIPNCSLVSWNAMIAVYAHNGLVDEALNLVQKIPWKTVESWNAMITGYAQNGHGREALKIF